MYIIISYDVDVSRVNRINKYLKRFLYWRLNSVFEGEVSNSQLEEIKDGIEKIINKSTDSVLIYILPSKKSVFTEVIGIEKEPIDFIL
ncbi:CRISPR-associated endonuclease Cas2 [Candidatus Bathyarchaeota archaeon]|nr:CRISPR-associated endonuclease Cas2 [Candidatus Bathyarchaeota archaeon]